MLRREDRYNIIPLNGTNFPTWKFCVESLITANGVLHFLSVKRPTKSEEQKEFDIKDAKSTDLIVQCTADKLKITFERKVRRIFYIY